MNRDDDEFWQPEGCGPDHGLIIGALGMIISAMGWLALLALVLLLRA